MVNRNQLYGKDFRLVIERLPNVMFFCNKATIPDLSVLSTEFPTPFTPIKVHGDKLEFSPLTITFNLDEDLQNYKELFNWLVSYSNPSNFEGYNPSKKTSKQAYQLQYSEASLFTSTNKDNPNIEFKFEQLFPTSLGSIELDIQSQSIEVLTCTATFAYTKFNVM